MMAAPGQDGEGIKVKKMMPAPGLGTINDDKKLGQHLHGWRRILEVYGCPIHGLGTTSVGKKLLG
jgi:hypothetical protein